MGHICQGRFKSFTARKDEHYLTLLRYVESKPLPAGLVKSCQLWPWNSFVIRLKLDKPIDLNNGPVTLPKRWSLHVNNIKALPDVEDIAHCIARGRPFGAEIWTKRVAAKLNLESTLRPRGRTQKCAP
jgi:putative transposase